MSWSRLGRILGGLGVAARQGPGLAWDLWRGATGEDPDDIDGFLKSVAHYGSKRIGQGWEAAFSADSGVGAAVGAIPEEGRDRLAGMAFGAAAGAPTGTAIAGPGYGTLGGTVAGAVVGAALGGEKLNEVYEFSYANTVSRPGAALFLGLNQAGKDDPLAVLKLSNWIQAWDKAEDTSVGQGVSLFAFNRDPRLAYEAQFVGTDPMNLVAGTVDTLARLFGDPTVVGGKAAMVLNAKNRLTVATADDIARIVQSGAFARFNEQIAGKSAAYIRDTYFPKHAHGAQIADILARADDKPAALRALLGDATELENLYRKNAELAFAVDQQVGAVARAQLAERAGVSMSPRLAQVVQRRRETVLKSLLDEQVEANHVAKMVASLDEFPRVGTQKSNELRTSITRSNYYQNGLMSAPIRVAYNMKPQRFLNLNDTSGDVQLRRLLTEAGADNAALDRYRSQFMAARSPGQRQSVMEAAEDYAVTLVADKHNISREALALTLANAKKSRAEAMDILRNKKYDAKTKRSVIQITDDAGVTHRVHLPIWITQEVNVMPIVDIGMVKKVASRHGRVLAGSKTYGVAADALHQFNRAWKIQQLLRVGWPLRVLTDEQLRLMAKIGTMVQLKNLAGQFKAFAVDGIDDLQDAATNRAARKAGVLPMLNRMPDSVVEDVPPMSYFDVDGYRLQEAFGASADQQKLYKDLLGASSAFSERVTGVESHLTQELRRITGDWRTVNADDPRHLTDWSHILNNQIGTDPVGRLFLQGVPRSEIESIVRRNPSMLANNARIRDVHKWTNVMEDVVNDLTMGNPEIAKAALERRASVSTLKKLAPDQDARPNVHGPAVNDLVNHGILNFLNDRIVRPAMTNLGTRPTDFLSRQPYFRHVYEAEATRRVRLMTDQGRRLTVKELDNIADRSREVALREVRELLYDLAEDSQLSHMLRFLSPFFMAQQEVATRWAGLLVENPMFMARLRLAWTAPEKAGLIVDEDGNTVDEEGFATIDGERVQVDTSERYFRFRAPEWFAKVPGVKNIAPGTFVDFNKKGANMMLQGLTFSGPLVQIPVNQIAKNRPTLEASLRALLPMGTAQSTWRSLLPATARRALTRAEGMEDRVYANAVMRRFQEMMVEYNLGRRTAVPTLKDAQDDTDKLWHLRMWASFISPVAPNIKSPFQPYIDAYRRRQEIDKTLDHSAKDYQTPEEWFYDTYGPDYFPLTQSFSRANDGVPPTMEAFKLRKQHEDLIADFPRFGGLIVGAEGAGEFSNAVYQYQYSHPVHPNTDLPQREQLSFEQTRDSPQVREGWIKYRQAMDVFENMRSDLGLPNYQVKAASQLAAARKGVIAHLEAKYPRWAEEFGKMDRNAAERNVKDLRKIAARLDAKQRDDIRGLQQYLKLRDTFSAILGQRKNRTLTAASNRPVYLAWESAVASLVEENPAFADLYYRWLEKDEPKAPEKRRK